MFDLIFKSEKHIYCSGIDPSIVQLEYVTVNESENYKSWVKSQVFYQHSHDVRAILIANKKSLITAGVDTKIIFKNLVDKTTHTIKKYNSLPIVNKLISRRCLIQLVILSVSILLY